MKNNSNNDNLLKLEEMIIKLRVILKDIREKMNVK
jgi:hypothetical protein